MDANRVDITFAPGPRAEKFAAETNRGGSFSSLITPLRRSSGTFSVVAVDEYDFRAEVNFVVPCADITVTPPDASGGDAPGGDVPGPFHPTDPDVLQPGGGPIARLNCLPCIGPTGFVTTAAGLAFPAGAIVTLRWEPGLGTTTVTVDPTGRFRAPMVILPRDVVGPRRLVAEVTGGPRADVTFLVVLPSVQPSGRDVAQMPSLPQLVQR